MNVSYSWLRSLVPALTDTPAGAGDRLAMYGAPVDDLVDLGGPLSDIIVARVLEVRPHPNADRLKLCRVDAGSEEPLAVVCGANNVRADAWYPFIPAGGTLPDGMKIRRAKIRGEESNGMLCSARELGLGRDHEGILELHGAFEPGESFTGAVGLNDTRIVIDVTPNRGDLLSHYGVARELAPGGESGIELAAVPGGDALADVAFSTGGATAEAHGIRISLEDAVGCPGYIGAVIRGVQIGPSPEWLASRLRAVGLRPINNVVDATNWVLMELGQPLHAFDLAALGPEIVVRRAQQGETLVTLDDEKRSLTPDVLVIADAAKPVALAGLMGGGPTEVTNDTVDVLLECAHFDPKTVREGRRLLGMNTDAAYRFERGVDPDGMERATRRAIAIIQATAGGTVDGAVVANAGLEPLAPVRLRTSRVVKVLGVPMDEREIASLLEPIGFRTEPVEGGLMVRIPGHRRYDVTREEDLVEEVARRRGYEEFPDEIRAFRASAVPDDSVARLEDRLRERLVGLGFLEARSLPLVAAEQGDVPLLLPLASTESRLRRALVPGLVRRVESNFNRGARDIRLFEIGTAFSPPEDGGLPLETTRVAVIFTGARYPDHWTGASPAFDLWDLRGTLGEIATMLGASVEPGEQADAGDIGSFDAGTLFRVVGRDRRRLGAGGRVPDGAVDAPAWAEPVWAAEVVLSTAANAAPPSLMFRPLPAHPAIERDVSLLVPVGVKAGDIEEAIRAAAGDLLEYVAPFDLYEGTGLDEGQRSIAFRLRFRAPDRTLTQEEVDTRMATILERLAKDHNVERRG